MWAFSYIFSNVAFVYYRVIYVHINNRSSSTIKTLDSLFCRTAIGARQTKDLFCYVGELFYSSKILKFFHFSRWFEMMFPGQ